MSYVGNIYPVTALGVTDSKGAELSVTGRFEVIEYEPEDREVGIFGNVFVVVPEGTPNDDWEDAALTADFDELIAQIDPERAKREAQAFEESMDVLTEAHVTMAQGGVHVHRPPRDEGHAETDHEAVD